ncbi:MAG: aromatic-ring-hydroxylating dioxygenase subunit beta [Kibdelosporangium sp.]
MTDPEAATAPPVAARAGQRVGSGDPAYFELHDFLIDEAALLDDNRLEEWQRLLARDLVYRIPVRRILYRDQGPAFDPVMTHLDDDHEAMTRRIRRLGSSSAWVEDPPSIMRRLVTNVRVTAVGPQAFEVESCVLALRSHWTKSQFDLISMKRQDTLRRARETFEIARRTIYLDQSALETPNLPMLF